jgi:hypothetical protein
MTINQTISKIKKLNNTLSKQKKKFLFFPTQAMEQRIKERVFVKGLSTGGLKRQYSSQSWKLTRSQKGKQIAFVDLNFEGSLVKSFKTEALPDKVVMGVIDDFNYFDKLGQEERYRKDTMLVPNDTEVDFLVDLVEYSIDFVIDQALI